MAIISPPTNERSSQEVTVLTRLLFTLSLAVLFCAPAYASCSAPQNPIEAENCLTGSDSSQWTVGGSGDPTLQGFATDISYDLGQTVNFKINTTATNYSIGIFRIGYYAGLGARKITTVSPSVHLPQTQPACLTDSTSRLYDCGNWGVSASWNIPATAVSGLYVAVLVRADTGGASQIFFIVRNDSSHSDVLYQTSDETWHAYNPYGGHSLYGDTGFNLLNRAYKVSYNRPFATPTLETATWLFHAEYPMIRWLEANGYDVSYFSSVDAARSGNLITNHKIYLSVGHDEYWSAPKRASVEAARAAGVNLAFFSGNEGFWKTRWENSIDGSNTPYRTLVCYKETLGPNSTPAATAAVDPLDPPTWTGSWRDPSKSPLADGGRPENALNGTIFMVNGPGADNTNLAIRVPAADGKMRLWRNTPVASQTSGQTWTFPAGTLGYEWDSDLDNGFRPAGLFDLSTASYPMTADYLLDYGGIYGAGTAIHHLTLYRYYANAGQQSQTPLGLVFGAGTVQWSWGLDANHDDSIGTAADPNMQQATANLFADMGVEPATLQAGLLLPSKTTDTQAPASTITSPGGGTIAAFGVPITIRGTAVDFGGGVVGGIEVSTDGGQTWHPATGRESWSYTWTPLASGTMSLLSRAVDDSANLEISAPGVIVTVPQLPISIDAFVSKDSPSASTTIQTPTFSTSSSGELLLAFVTADYLSGANTTVSSVTGGGLTWNLVIRSNAQTGDSEIWRAFSASPLSGASVTATLSQSVLSSITVKSFAGVNTSGTNGSGAIGATISKSASTGAPSASLTTTQNYSWVFGVGNDYDNAIPRTPGTGQSLVHQDLTATGDTYWVQMQNAPTILAGTSVSINDTAPTTDRWNLAAVEVLPALTGALNISGTISPTSAGVGAMITLAGPVSAMTAADASGNFSFGSLPNGSYIVTPAKNGFVFSPSSQAVTLSGSSVTTVNFAASQTYSISGTISPSASGSGAVVILGGASSATTTADSSGSFSFVGLANGSYTITPSKSGFVFSPSSQPVTVSGASVSGVSFTGTPLNFSISGSVSSPGAGATIAISGAATGNVTADANGNYSFTGLGNGSYTITPSKLGYSFNPTAQVVTVSGGNVINVNFVAQALSIGSLTIDAKVSIDGTTASSSITSPSIMTAYGNELLLAFISTDYLSGSNTSVTSISGASLTWSLVLRTNVQKGSAEIWRAFAPTPLSGATITAALSQSVLSSMTVMSIAGVDTTGSGGSGAIGAAAGKNAASGAPTATLVTTRNNSWVFGVGNDYSNALAHTPGSGQSLVHQDLTSAGDTYWVQMLNASTPAGGTSVTVNDTAPTGDSYNLSVVEVLPSLGAFSISGNVSPASSGITIGLSGTVSGTMPVDGSGNYSFSGLPNGAYTVTPSKSGTTFSPTSQAVTVNGSSATGVNFSVPSPVLAVAPSGIALTALQGGASPVPASINIANAGSNTLTYSVISDSAWLTATPTSGTAPQTLQVLASPAGLAPGSYAGNLTITSSGANGSPAVVPVNFNVTVLGDWLTIDHDNVRSGIATDETTISASNVNNLHLKWSSVVDGSVTTQPLYVHSVQIAGQNRDITVVGTAGNTLWALDANTGALIWKRNFGPSVPNNWAIPDGFGIEAPPVIDRATNRVYTVSTDGMFRTISLIDGTDAATAFALIANPNTNNVWGGLNKLNNNVYVATASNGGDVAPWRGQVYQVDVSATPKTVGDFVVVPSISAPNGGGGIWGYGGVSVDPASGNVYATSADDSIVNGNGKEGYTPYSDSIIALNSNVGLLGYYQATEPSQYGCSGVPCDLDFASTPVIFQPAGCSQMLAAGNKNGNLYLFKASDLALSGQPLQILTLNVPNDSLGSGGVGGVPVYNPITNMLYITDAGAGVSGVAAGIVAMNVTANCTLQVAWSHPLSGSDFPNSTPTLANGVIFAGEGSTGIVHAYNAQTGTELWNSGIQLNAASTFAAPTIANGSVYVGAWTSYGGGGIVAAFGLNSPVLSVAPTAVQFAGTVGGSNPATATVNLTNTGSGTLSFAASTDSSWLTVSPASGAAPQALQVSASITGLAAGTYTGHVTITSSGTQGSQATITATLTLSSLPTWTISGNVSASGASASVMLSGTSTGTSTADGSGNYSFSGLSNGSYTVTPTKSGYTFNPANQPVTLNGANVSGINFTATQNAGSGLAIDANVSKDTTAAAKTIVAPAFSTKAGNELLLAFVSTDYLSGSNTTVSGIVSTGLTWTLVVRTNVQSGSSEVWRAFATAPLTSMTATATLSQSVLASMTIISFIGVDTTGTNGSGAIGATASASAKTGAPKGTLVTTRNNSWVLGVGNDYDSAIARSLGAGQTLLHQALTSTGDTYWVQMQNSTTPLSGTSVTINDTAPTTDRYNLSIVEVRTP
jgi:hypothetical protein